MYCQSMPARTVAIGSINSPRVKICFNTMVFCLSESYGFLTNFDDLLLYKTK